MIVNKNSSELKLESVEGLQIGDSLLVKNYDCSASEYIIISMINSSNNTITIQSELQYEYVKNASLFKSAYILDIINPAADPNIQLKDVDELKFVSVEGINSGDVLHLTEFSGVEPFLSIRLYRDINVNVDPKFSDDDFSEEKYFESLLLEKKYPLETIRKDGAPNITSINDWFYLDILNDDVNIFTSELDDFKKHIKGDEKFYIDTSTTPGEYIIIDPDTITSDDDYDVIYQGRESNVRSEISEYLLSLNESAASPHDEIDSKELNDEIDLWIKKELALSNSKVKYYFVVYVVVPYHYGIIDNKIKKNDEGDNYRLFHLPESGKYSTTESENILVLKRRFRC